MKTIGLRIRQDGQTVARVDGAPPQAVQEIMRYADQYRQDGEITIQHNAEGHWKRWALLCQWPLPSIRAVAPVPGVAGGVRMTKPVAYQGLLNTGPLAAQKTRVHTSPRLPAEGGFYIWMAGKGPNPPTWKWIPEKKDNAKVR